METENVQDTSFEQLEALINRVREAQSRYAQYSQKEVDAIFQHAASVATANRIHLAKTGDRVFLYDTAGFCVLILIVDIL